jgi:predicted metal-dependent peptidase
MPESSGPYVHRGTRAIQRMVEFAPSTGGLALWVRHEDLPPDAQALVATDGTALYYGPAFENLTVAEQTALVAHEVLHIALRHPQRLRNLSQLIGDVDLELFNICADAVVNSALSHLTWITLPRPSVFLDTLLAVALSEKQPVEKSLLEWDVEKLYRAIDDRRVGARFGRTQNRHQSGGSAGTAGGGSRRTKEHDSPEDALRGDDRQDGPRSARVRALGRDCLADLLPHAGRDGGPEDQAEAARMWSERLLRAHAGDGAHSMLRTLIADVPRTRTPWEQLLRVQLARGLAARPGISWSRPARSYIANQGRAGPHRRLPWTPAFSGVRPVPHLVVIVDVSGSIEDALMEKFAREIAAITRRLEAALVLIIGDEAVRKVVQFAPGRADWRDIEFNGGGGTDFTPLLQEADKHHPDIAVVLTDLDGPAHWRPTWPVLWAVPHAHATATQPFGRKLILT